VSEGDDVVTEQVSRTVSDRRNKWTFGVGTIGRDMVYTLVSMFLVVYLTEVVNLPDAQLWWATTLILAARLFDAVADIVMGAIVDNTQTRFGHYKPWIAGGALASAIITTLLFTNLHLSGSSFVAVFALLYLLWSLSWTANDIPYWSLLPALTLDQKQRESFGSLAKIFATIGLFTVVVAIIPVTNALGGDVHAWTMFTIAVVVVMLLGQSVTLFGVREPDIIVGHERTTLKEIAGVVFHNDQLLWTAIAMVLFMTGYVTTTTFGVYFFKYVYRNENMYSPFAAVLGVAQLIGYATFPILAKRMKRRTLYGLATALILAGYVVFFFSPMNMIPIGVAGLLLFLGQSWVTLLMLVFLTDTIEYGQWKLGRRNVAVTFALQPFINKVGAALATQIVSVAVIISGVNSAATPDDVTPGGLLIIKIAMLILPPILIIVGYLIYRAKYRIDEEMYATLVSDLKERGQLR
jgi:melibiose permease/lactose/raffinose/galactose permease